MLAPKLDRALVLLDEELALLDEELTLLDKEVAGEGDETDCCDS
jgi:hypothetical protein